MSKTRISIIIYLIWFSVNFILTTVPIAFTILFPDVKMERLFSSLLIFIYTLLILSTYVFYSHLKTESTSLSYADVIFWITLTVIIVICITFPLYNIHPDFSEFININIKLLAVITILAGLILAVPLHYPILRKQIEDLYNRKVMWENPDRIRKDVTNMKREIQQENSK